METRHRGQRVTFPTSNLISGDDPDNTTIISLMCQGGGGAVLSKGDVLLPVKTRRSLSTFVCSLTPMSGVGNTARRRSPPGEAFLANIRELLTPLPFSPDPCCSSFLPSPCSRGIDKQLHPHPKKHQLRQTSLQTSLLTQALSRGAF